MGKRRQDGKASRQPRAAAAMGPQGKAMGRRCEGSDDLAALDRMRRELFDADAARFSKGQPNKDDLVAALR